LIFAERRGTQQSKTALRKLKGVRETMKVRLYATLATLLCTGIAQAQIHVDRARIGCLDIQKDPNLTGLVAAACNGKASCSYKAPTESEYRRVGVVVRTRAFCTQAMEIVYQCGSSPARTVTVPGDAWNHPAAQLACASLSSQTAGSLGHSGAALNTQPVFPIQGSQDDHFPNSGGFMHTDVTIIKNADGSAHLNAVTHIWEVTELRGFRGAVAVAVLDANQRPLWVSQTQKYGVDGRALGTADRRENWSDTMPSQLVPQARYLAIIQKWNPKNAFDDINNWLQGIGQVVNELAPIIKTIKTMASS
jgi:hypothetical protein